MYGIVMYQYMKHGLVLKKKGEYEAFGREKKLCDTFNS